MASAEKMTLAGGGIGGSGWRWRVALAGGDRWRVAWQDCVLIQIAERDVVDVLAVEVSADLQLLELIGR